MNHKIFNTVIALSLLAFISMTANATVALRISCSGSDEGALVYINGKKKGSCPGDFFVEDGDIHIRAIKVDGDYEQVFEEKLTVIDDVRKIKVSLSKPQLTAAAIKRNLLAKQQQEKELADAVLAEARNGDINAMNVVVGFYEEGKGVSKSLEKADYWKNKAIDTQKYNEAMSILTKAEQGDLASMDDVADIYTSGEGFKKDIEKAQQWRAKKVAILQAQDEEYAQDILKKAQEGDIASMQAIAELYQSGKGVEQSAAQAKEWEEKYLTAKNEQEFQESKDAELQALKDELENTQFLFALKLHKNMISESIEKDGIGMPISISLLKVPSAVVSTITDLLGAPYTTVEQILLQSEIDTHAAKWGSPDSMVGKASQ